MVVWLLETSSEAFLLGLLFVVFFGPDRHGFIRDLLFGVGAVALVFVTTGYILTTAILRLAWKRQRSVQVSIIAILLFLIHSQIFFVVSGGSTQSERLLIQAAGACIVFFCTYTGSLALQKWIKLRRE